MKKLEEVRKAASLPLSLGILQNSRLPVVFDAIQERLLQCPWLPAQILQFLRRNRCDRRVVVHISLAAERTESCSNHINKHGRSRKNGPLATYIRKMERVIRAAPVYIIVVWVHLL